MNRTQPQPKTRGHAEGDLFFELDEDGNWSVQLWFVDYVTNDVGLFRDVRGELFEQRFDALHRGGFASPGADDINEDNERRRYQGRSRSSAPSRRNATATTKQINYINYLGRRRRLSLADLRAYSPSHSLRKLTIGQAGQLIDWLRGNGKEPATYPPPQSRVVRPKSGTRGVELKRRSG